MGKRVKYNYNEIVELEYFFKLVENSSDIVSIISEDFNFVYQSPVAERILGWNFENVKDESILKYCHNDDVGIVKKTLAQLLGKPGKSLTFNHRFKDTNDNWRFFESVAKNLLHDPVIKAIVVYSRDITERKQAEQNALILKSVVEHSTDGVIITDPTYKNHPIIYANPSFESHIGIRHEGLIGKSIRDVYTNKQNTNEIKRLNKAFNKNVPCTVTLLNDTQKKQLWNQISLSPIYDAQGKIINFVGIQQDITYLKDRDREQEEENLQSKLRTDIKNSFSQHSDLSEALTKVMEIITETLDMAAGGIWLVNPNSNSLELAGGIHLPENTYNTIAIGESKVGRIAQEQIPHVTNNLQNETAVLDPSWMASKHIVSFVGYPLIISEKLNGVIGLYAQKPQDQFILKVLSSVSETITYSVEHHLQQQQLLENEKRLSFLDHANKLLFSTLDSKLVLQYVCELIVPKMADWCAIYLLNEDSLLQSTVSNKSERFNYQKLKKLLQEYPANLSDSNGVAEVIRSGKTEYYPYISDTLYRAATKDRLHEQLLKELVTSYLCVPLTVRGRTIGAITMANVNPGKHFDIDDKQLAEELANRASIAIDNTRLFDSNQLEIIRRKQVEKEIKILNKKLEKQIDKKTRDLYRVENRFQDIYQSSKDGIAFSDLNGRFLDVNNAFLKLTGYTREEIFGMNYDALTPESYHAIESSIVADILNSGEPREYEKQYICKNNQIIDISVTAFLVKDRNDKPIGLSGIVRDITEEKKARTALANAEEKYRSIVSSLHEGILLQDLEGKIITYNDSMLSLLGLESINLHNKNIRDLGLDVYTEDLQQLSHQYFPAEIALKEGKPVTNVTVGIKKKDNSFLWLRVNAEPVWNPEQKKLTSVVSTFTDISERRQYDESLKELNAQLARSNKELQDFASVASHDLQEPLRKVQTFGERLLTNEHAVLSEEGKDYLARMLGAAGRMRKLINDLLTFSKVTTKAEPFKKTDLNTLVEEVLSDLEISAEEAGAIVSVDDLPTIECDPTQMRQLLQNLISNALKFRKKEVTPMIDIKSVNPEAFEHEVLNFKKDDFCSIIVKDNGIGFEEKYRDRIFDVFQRLHGQEEYEGTGVGLAVCRKIVLRHSGTIIARSEPGIGSEFVITLPKKQNKRK